MARRVTLAGLVIAATGCGGTDGAATASAAAEASLTVLAFPLPTDSGLEAVTPKAATPLPARVTLSYRASDEQEAERKVYVGQKYVGLLNGPDAATTWSNVEQKLRDLVTAGVQLLEVDAAPEIPLQDVLAAVARAPGTGLKRVTLAASSGEWPWKPLSAGAAATAPAPSGLPSVPAGAAALAHPEAVLVLALDGDALTVRPPGGAWTSVGADGFVAAIKAHADRDRDPARPALSRSRVVVHAAGDARWDRVQPLLMECAKVGIWDIAFAVQAADGPR